MRVGATFTGAPDEAHFYERQISLFEPVRQDQHVTHTRYGAGNRCWEIGTANEVANQ